MGENTAFIFGMIFSILVCLVLLYSIRKKFQGHYDEMQLKIRGDGYKVGFLSLLFFNMAIILLYDTPIINYVSVDFLIYAALIFSAVIFVIYCIMKDAFTLVGMRSNRIFALYFVIAAINIIPVVLEILDGTFLENGKLGLSGGGANLICAIAFTCVFIAFLIKFFEDKRENSYEES